MMRALRIGLALAVVFGGSVSADWPQWRGPHGSGIADDKNLPERWSATENLAWKARLGGVGVSSPIVAGNAVFVTSQLGTGISRQGPRLAQGAADAGERSISGSGSKSAKVVFLVEAFNLRQRTTSVGIPDGTAMGPLESVHDKHNLATPSPVTDGQLVYAWFGTGQIARAHSGKLVWRRPPGPGDLIVRHQLGSASSPTCMGTR